MIVENITNYQKWKRVTDSIYAGELEVTKGAKALIELLAENDIKLRKNHRLLGVSFFVYDKDIYSMNQDKPLGLGVVYLKPNQIKTQDIFIVRPDGEIERYYSEASMVKKYPWLKGVHKETLPL